MKTSKNTKPDFTRLAREMRGRQIVGRIVGRTADGRALVDFEGNPFGPAIARVATEAPAGLDVNSEPRVLLTFELDDPSEPIIVAFVRDQLFGPESRKPLVASLDGERVVLEADNEIVLKCGASSLTLRRDGKVVIQGVEVVSRARRANKIRGGSVKIN